MLDRFAAAEMNVTIVDTASPAGLPCFQVFLGHDEQAERHFGAGCHRNRATALLRALTEAGQSRLGYLAGSRDDLRARAYRPPARVQNQSARSVAKRHFDEAPTLPWLGFVGAFKDLVVRTRELSGTSPIAVDLRRRVFGNLPVVMVVAPGLHHPAPERQ
jgi:ribosomal protein S12 methylthiotransferase accessory factor